jgi:hypothetical protein
MAKVTKTSSPAFAKGGKTKMFGKQHAGPQAPGNTAHAPKGDGGKFAKGGTGRMFGKGSAKPSVAGHTGKPTN